MELVIRPNFFSVCFWTLVINETATSSPGTFIITIIIIELNYYYYCAVSVIGLVAVDRAQK
jgi:hypothetical protein